MYYGYYLNLDSNTDRRDTLEAHLDLVGAAGRYRRFPAVNGREAAVARPEKLRPGSLGLWLTHENLLAAHAGSDRHLHIIEDDARLPRDAVARFDALLENADRQLPDWEVLFTETFVPFDPQVFQTFARHSAAGRKTGKAVFADLKTLFLAGATSMFLNRNAIAKFDALTRNQWRRGHPRDMYLRHLIRSGQLKAHVTLPFLTTYSPEQGNASDIRGQLDASHRMTDCYRRSFFIEEDLAALRQEMAALGQGMRHDLHSRIYLDMLAFSLSDRWEPF